MWYLFLAHMDAGNGKQGDALVLGSENWRSFFCRISLFEDLCIIIVWQTLLLDTHIHRLDFIEP